MLQPDQQRKELIKTQGCNSLEKSETGFSNQKRISRFLTKQIDRRSLGLRCIKGTEECCLDYDIFDFMMHQNPRELGFLCAVL